LIGALKETPWEDGIHHVFDGGIARAYDARQVEMLVRLNDQVKVPGCSGDASVAEGQISGQELAQFIGKGHVIS
jgi:hypothetical protein